MFFRQFLKAAIALSLSFPVSADYFTNPPSFVGNMNKTQDLSTSFVLGQTVQITWYLTNLSEKYISLKLVRWDISPGVAIQSFITNEPNTGFYTWTIGSGDNIDEAALSISPNFEIQLSDPTGQSVSTGDPPGFINNTLTSRGFVIKSNASSTSTSSSTATSTSASASNPSSTSIQTPLPNCPSLTVGDKAGIGIGAGFAVLLLFAILLFLHPFRRQSQQSVHSHAEPKQINHPGDPAVVGWTGPTPHAAPIVRNEFSELPTQQPPMELSGESRRTSTRRN